MDIVWEILIGIAAGWLAGMIMKSRFGLIGDLIVGVIGALVGGWLFGKLGIAVPGGPLVGALITATVGAVVLIASIRFIGR
jgi:uncharacterized membrane protein YeaQ/YmgE (transglycosylase-associated protein family)